MVAALWLVVAISVVALAFSIDARERRTLGLNANERGIGRGAALGALANIQAQLDAGLRANNQGNQALQNIRAGDPWMGIDSAFTGALYVDSARVDVVALDLGKQLNINTADVNQLRAFLSYTIGDYAKADQLAQTITDWRDIDDTPQQNGDERDGYIKKGILNLPANGPFRQVSDLLMVEAMTPEIYARIAPDLTTYGPGQINVNTAPVEVLRSIPGITDDIINNILNQRGRGLRIASLASLVPGAAQAGRGGRGGPPQNMQNVQLTQLQNAAGVNTTQVLFTMTVKSAPQAQPVKLIALVARGGTNTTVTWKQW
jgi:type II secretory pathway component PulK